MTRTRRTTQRIASVAAATLIAGGLTLAGGTAIAAEQIETVDGVTYTFDNADPDAGAVVTDYDDSDNPTHPNLSLPAYITVDGNTYPVVEIGEGALSYESLESVSLPNTLERIGYSALSGNALTWLIVPESVSEFEDAILSDNPDLNWIMFMGEAPETSTPNPLASDPATAPELRVLMDHLDSFGWPDSAQWHGHDIVPTATVRVQDPVPDTGVFSGVAYVVLNQTDESGPYATLDNPRHDDLFGVTPPEGYELVGWLANGEPFDRSSDRITGNTILTPLWFNSMAIQQVTITASADTVEENGTLTMTAEAFNGLGESLGDITDDVEFSTDNNSDVVDGANITFGTEGPRTVFGIYWNLELSAQPIGVTVTPAAVEDDLPVEEPPAEDDPPAEESPVGESEDEVVPPPEVLEEELPPTTSGPQLATTGFDDPRFTLAIIILLTAVGAILKSFRRPPIVPVS